jgi:hypothetical protein
MPRVQYAFRPAKHIQRRMIVDACRRIGLLVDFKTYEYVGFGGLEFVDFELVHRELSINRMTSIEHDAENRKRYRSNRPFSCIDLQFGRASELLPGLHDEARPRIVWLDYMSRLNHEVLQDIGTCIRRLVPGSIVLVTVNAAPASPGHVRRDQLVDDVAEERIPLGTTDPGLARWGLAAAQYRILRAEVNAAIGSRPDDATVEQLFHFRYSDGVYMLTWGGAIVMDADRGRWHDVIGSIEQIRAGEKALLIDAPLLTALEAMHLNALLPDLARAPVLHGIPESECDAYVRLYRWYPPIPGPFGSNFPVHTR